MALGRTQEGYEDDFLPDFGLGGDGAPGGGVEPVEPGGPSGPQEGNKERPREILGPGREEPQRDPTGGGNVTTRPPSGPGGEASRGTPPRPRQPAPVAGQEIPQPFMPLDPLASPATIAVSMRSPYMSSPTVQQYGGASPRQAGLLGGAQGLTGGGLGLTGGSGFDVEGGEDPLDQILRTLIGNG